MNLKIASKNIESLVFTYKRIKKKLRILYAILFCIFFTLFVIKFFSKKGEIIDMKVLDYINREVDRCLTYKTKEQQNEEFKKLKSKFPIEPIRISATTAVFKHTSSTQSVILKRVIHSPSNNLNEDCMSLSLQSPYICKTLKAFRTNRILPDGTTQVLIWIISEFLDVKISQRAVAGNENKIRAIIHDALLGLKYLHSQNVAHLDLKIANIMGKTTPAGVIYKLIDFGYSQKMPDSGFLIIEKKNYGTYPYKPAEVVFKNEHGLKSDIWSLGAICWFLSLQYTPFYFDSYEKDIASYRKFLKPKTDSLKDLKNHRFIFNENTSIALKHFIKLTMQIEPKKRPTAVELLKHPFISGEDLDLSYDSGDDIIEEDSGYGSS